MARFPRESRNSIIRIMFFFKTLKATSKLQLAHGELLTVNGLNHLNYIKAHSIRLIFFSNQNKASAYEYNIDIRKKILVITNKN